MKTKSYFTKWRYLSLLCTWIFSIGIIAQNVTITGNVIDQNQIPIIGGNIIEKGTNNGTVTDIDGNFTLTVPQGATLQVSYIGYITNEVQVGNQTTLQIVLREDMQALDEVVVVGYGTQQKVNLTGAVARIGEKELESRPIQNVSSALQGLVSGLTVMSGQGRPGQDGATLRIRGTGTLNTASPYILIDGVESGTMNSLDPNDIESISVLKDASSAAIYGSKASNGVILITTKRGKAGTPRVSYNGFYGIQRATELTERLSSYDYARLYNQALINDGNNPRFSDEDLRKFQDGSSPYTHSNTDWYDLAFKNGMQQQHNVTASGGTDNTKYHASVGYLGQEGILPNSNRKQFNGRINLDVAINDRLDMKMNLAYIKNDYSDPTNSYVRGGSDQIIRQLNIIAPWIVNKYEDGTYGTVSDGNPIAWLDLDQTIDRKNQNFTGILAADYKFSKNLTGTLQGSYINNMQHYREFMKDIQYNPNKYHGPNQLDERYYLWNRTTFDALLNYDKLFNDVHTFKVLLGWHTEKYNYNENTMVRRSFPNNNLTDMNAGTASTQTNSGFSRALAMISGFGRINYNYASKYHFEANFRADASSRFSSENRWGYFPSFSAGWRISEEAFMESLRDDVNNLMLRASWGLLGNQDALDDYYPYLNTYNLGGSYPFDGSLQSGYYQSSYRIPSISWEKARTYGLGIDLSVFNHYNASIDLYDRKTTDIIMDVPVPAEFALGAYKDNVGAMRNRGVEVSLGYNNRWKDWSLSVNGNVSYNKNEILNLGGVERMISGSTINQIGHAISSFYVYKADGFFQSQEEADAYAEKYNPSTGTTLFSQQFKAGDIRYVDVNGDGKIDGDDRVISHSVNPAFIYGLNVNAGYKNFDLSMIFSGAAKAARILNSEAFGSFQGDVSHPTTIWLDAWSPDNTSAKMPRIYNSINSNSAPERVMSTFWLQNTSFVRLKNLQFGYTLPASLINSIGISNARVYYSAENLFTIDNMPISIDPENNSERASSYPIVQTHSFGVSLTF